MCIRDRITEVKLLDGVDINTRSEFLTASAELETILSDKLSFFITSIADLLLSKVIIFLIELFFLRALNIDEPIKPQPIIVIWSNIKDFF